MLSVLSNLLKPSRLAGVSSIAVREYAARKGTREKRLKLKKKRKLDSTAEPPPKKVYGRDQNLVYTKQRPLSKSVYPVAIDDVFFHSKFRDVEYSFKDVVDFHREIHHETVYNRPDAPMYFRVELDLKLPNRVVKCMDPWRTLVELKTPFLLEGAQLPTVLAFCPESSDIIEQVERAGAEKAGGLELIKAVQDGEVKASDYDYVVAHPLVVTELTPIRGLMKRQFPSVKGRTLGIDLPTIVKALKNGVKIKLDHNDLEPDYGSFVACAGRLNMETQDLEGNFNAFISDTLKRKPLGKDPEDFILQVTTFTPFTFEKLKVNWRDFLTP